MISRLAGLDVEGLVRLAKTLCQGHGVESDLEHWLREELLEGHDHLGNVFCLARTAEERRPFGQTFTPPDLVAHMLHWAVGQSVSYSRIVDPGAGTGRYVLKALRRFPNACGVAIEQDPQVAALLEANARLLGVADRLTVIVGDYRNCELPESVGPTLFIGNPPYTRHHNIDENWKTWYAQGLRAAGVKGSKLAGLHLHFFLRTCQLAAPGDVACFVTAAEWLDTGYGAPLRALLAGQLGGVFVKVVSAERQVFKDALVSAAITGFRPGTLCESIAFQTCDAFDIGREPASSLTVTAEVLASNPKWSAFLGTQPEVETDPSLVELGSLFKVQRGQVTGCNRVWIADEHAQLLPSRYRVPCVTDASDISKAGGELLDSGRLKTVVDLPAQLDTLPENERHAVAAFLNWAKSEGAHESYIAQHRNPWWRVNLKESAPIVMTYMGRKGPSFALNTAGARLINIAHGLYPRSPLPEAYLRNLVDWLNKNIGTKAGRVYAGGLTKFEPSEVMRLRIPSP
jgi:adenine-specific DNA-methyltransferase